MPSLTAGPVPCCQHVVFYIGWVLNLLVPDIPESVQIKVKREYYLAKQALAENEVSPHPQPSCTHCGVAPARYLLPSRPGCSQFNHTLLNHPSWTQALLGTNGAKDNQPSASGESGLTA